MRITAERVDIGRKFGARQRPSRFLSRGFVRQAKMPAQRFGDVIAHRHQRIKGCGGILKDHADVLPAYPAQRALVER